MPIQKILIFNRGEIACRIIRTAQALGYSCVGVYTQDEPDPLHAEMADEAVMIGAGRSCYLSAEAAIASACRVGADALHPGYGFLSESPALAHACAAAGMTFIGPSAAAMQAMGDKASARRLMEAAGIPCVPGYHGERQDDEFLRAQAERIGWPLMVKAAAGGGGKGMRLVSGAEQLGEALIAARSEAHGSFGSDALILERALQGVRHVEVQVFADRYGHTIHLGERDCSIQRRHQKVIEETPCPAISADLRAQISSAAVAAAKAVAYVGAGTIEFLVEPDGTFYFLEMNTRIQVEHPITEEVTGVDVVAWQIQVAAGHRLPPQDQVTFNGAAIEARIYAETPDLEFLPRSGTIAALHFSQTPGVRIDHALRPGSVVSPNYDPLLAKVIARGADREEARRKLVRTLEASFIGGVETNRAFLIRVLQNSAFVACDVNTSFIAEQRTALGGLPPTDAQFAVATLLLDSNPNSHSEVPRPLRSNRTIAAGAIRQSVEIAPAGVDGWQMRMRAGGSHLVLPLSREGSALRYVVDGVRSTARFCWRDQELHVAFRDRDLFVNRDADTSASDASQGKLRSPLDGRVVAVHVEPGRAVAEGDLIATIEAMKLEYLVKATGSGTVLALHVVAGGSISRGAEIADIAYA